MMRLRNRQRLRRKEVADLAASLESQFGSPVFGPDEVVDLAEAGPFRVALVDNTAVALLIGTRATLTVRGALRYRPTKRYVTVDMGAVKFVYNGADVMAPGIVEADPGIAVGDFVWVRDERNRQPLAIGEALMTGTEMNVSEKGKSIKSIHHVGDELWKLEEPA
jgi:PUA domain protein